MTNACCDRVLEHRAVAQSLRDPDRDRGCFAHLRGDRDRETAEVGVDLVAVTGVERASEDGDAERGTELARGVVDRRRHALLGAGK